MINKLRDTIPVFTHKFAPWAHQSLEVLEHWNKVYRALFWEMGCGKTRPLIDSFCSLFYAGEIDGVLIVSDKGCYRGWEADHLPKHLSPEVPVRVATYASSMSTKEAQAVNGLLVAKDDCLDILVINIEALRSDRGRNMARTFLQRHYAMMIVDEATSIKNRKAKQTEACHILGPMAEYRRIATGTPITNSPLDLWSMCEFLKPGIMGCKTYTEFQTLFAITRLVETGHGRYNQILGYRNLDALTKLIQPFSSRKKKEECIDLPAKTYKTIYVEQTEEQEAAYNAMRDTAVNLFEQGQVTSTSALTTLIRLHQINCGHVNMDEGGIKRFPTRRTDALIDVLKLCEGKAVIWGHYQEDMRLICEAIEKEFDNKYCYVEYHGQRNEEQRKEALNAFRDEDLCRILVGTPAAGGKGLNDLVVANTCIYYSNHYNLERRLQSEDRLHRPGQRNPVTIVDLVTPNTVDEKILNALLTKKDLAHQVLDSWRELFS